MRKSIYLIILLLSLFSEKAVSQEIEQNVEERLQTFFKKYTASTVDIGTCRLDSFRIDFQKKKIRIYASEQLSYQPHRPESVDNLYQDIRQLLPGPVNYFMSLYLPQEKPSRNSYPMYTEKARKTKNVFSLT